MTLTLEQQDTARDQTLAFGTHYDYDVAYLLEMLDGSPDAFRIFQAVPDMASYRKKLPAEASFVARIAAFSVVDCGPCLELTIKMGREAGVSDNILRGALRDGEGLPDHLAEVHGYAAQIAAGATPAPDRVDRMRQKLGAAGLVELSLNIASSLVFPAVKRTLGHAQSCALTNFSV
jgi:hypothetical protein